MFVQARLTDFCFLELSRCIIDTLRPEMKKLIAKQDITYEAIDTVKQIRAQLLVVVAHSHHAEVSLYLSMN